MKNKILILNGNMYDNAVANLGKMVYTVKAFLDTPEEFKLVLFTGGEDVSPQMYGHTSPQHRCMHNLKRDLQELEVFQLAKKHRIKMTGICRGSQFLNVMNGGWLMHHINRHSGETHDMTTATGETFKVTSTHHQMCVPAATGSVIGWSTSRRSDIYIGNADLPCVYTGPETEAIWYPETLCAAVQYHPEYMPEDSNGYLWYHTLVTDLLCMSAAEFTEKYVNAQTKSALTANV